VFTLAGTYSGGRTKSSMASGAPESAPFQQVAGAQDADEVIEAVAADEHAFEGAGGEAVADFRFAVVQIDQIEILAVGHDLADTLLVEAQDIGDDLLFADVEDARPGTLTHQDLDFVVADRRVRHLARPEQTQQQAGRRGKQPDQRARQQREQIHRRRNHCGNALRRQQPEALGNQFADDHREIGHPADDQRHRDGPGVGRQRGDVASHSPSGAARVASPMAPLRMPTLVMPT
jgi:hypothetical protein